MSDLTKEKRKLSASLELTEKDMKLTREEVEKAKGVLKRISVLFPDLVEGEDVANVVEELKVEVATEFDRGFEAALDQLKVLCPEADVEKFDLDKVVVND